MTMRCEDVRLALWPEPGPRPVEQALAEAFEHYARCDACQRFFQVQRSLDQRLGRLARAASVPAGLRERVRSAITHEAVISIARRRAWWLTGAGTAMLGAAAALVLVLTRPSMPANVAQPLVAAARAGLDDGGTVFTSSDVEQVEAWLENHVGYPVVVPEITDALLKGGRVAEIGGTKGAAVVYLMHGRPLSYFALASNQVMGRPVRGDRVIPVSSDGYEVALWSERGFARAIVAPMPRSDVVAIAEECRRKAAMSTS